MKKSLSALALSVVGLACAPGPEVAVQPPEPPDAGETIDAGEIVDAGVVKQWTLGWSPSATTISRRDHHAALIVERGGHAWLFVIGGTDAWQTLYDDVLRAPIDADGTLQPFEVVGHLPQVRAGHVAVELDGRLVVTGGLTEVPQGRYVLDRTAIAPLRDDATLGAWVDGPQLPQAVMHHTCNVVSHRMYCIGGRITGNLTGTLAVSSAFTGDGSLAGYQPVSALPHPLGFQVSFVHGGALYLAGGLQRAVPADAFIHLDEIWRAELAADGSLGAWARAGTMDVPLNVGAAAVFEDRVYFVGGMNAADQVETHVHVGTLEADGGVGAFEVPDGAPQPPRMHVHQLPRLGDRLYLVGGRLNDDQSTSDIEVGMFR